MDPTHLHAFILAGGRGERFWPLSTFARPKQFTTLFGGTPLIAQAVGRLEGLVPPANIRVITSADLVAATREALPALPDHALVDGLPVKGLPIPHDALVKGDARSLLIACASILAKVTRDRICLELDARHPGYGLAQHKGYGTRAHLDALRRLGPAPCHRRSFAPVRAIQDDLPFPD